jgi:hypothetical protein
VCPLATFARGQIRMMTLMMTDERTPESRTFMGLGRSPRNADRELENDTVMDRLARMLAESTAPPSPKRRLIEELLSGNFASLDKERGHEGGNPVE